MAYVRPTLTDHDDLEGDGHFEVTLADFSKTILWGLLLFFLTIAVSMVSVSREYVEHDAARVEQNQALGAWPGIRPIWRQMLHFPNVSPLTYTSHLVEAQLWGTKKPVSPAGFRLVNVFLHGLTVLALWHLLRRLELPGAWTAAGIVGVHPIAMANVGWISQRPMILGALLGIIALTVLFRLTGLNPVPAAQHRWLRWPARRWILVLLVLALSLLTAGASPSIAVVLWMVAAVVIWWEKGTIAASDWRAVRPMIFTSVVVVAIAIYVVATRGLSELRIPEVSAGYRALAAAKQYVFYAGAAVFPVNLQFAYEAFSTTKISGAAAAGVVVLAVAISIFSRRFVGRGALATVILFVIVLLPAVMWVNQDEAFGGWVAAGRAYPAMMVVATAIVATLAAHLQTRREAAIIVSAVAVCAVGAAGAFQSWLYRSPQRLWTHVLDREPTNLAAGVRLAQHFVNSGELSKADSTLVQLIQMHPAAVTPLVHLGDLEQSLKRYDRAQSLYLRALNLEPDHFEANYGLARLQTVTRDSSVAMAQLEKALTLRPNDARVHNDIGQLLAMRGELALAKAKYEHALQLDPQLNAARVNLATVLYQSGETTAAAKLLEQVLQMDRRNYEAFLNAGAMLGTMGEFAKAAELFRAVVSIKPDFPEGYSNLAMALIGQATSEKVETKEKIALLSEAVRMFEKAAELDPAKPDHSQNAAAVARQRDQLRQLEISPG